MNLDQYIDDLDRIELFPDGKRFRLTFDSTVNKMRILAKLVDDFDELRNTFKTENKAAFFSQAYGYRAEPNLYCVNKFGYFAPGLVFEIFEWIKNIYGDLSCIAISKNCLSYLDTFLRPMKKLIKDIDRSAWVIPNIAEDSGRNNELRAQIKALKDSGVPEDQIIVTRPYEFREYQRNAINYLIFKGLGRGVIEIPTGGGKSFILANFIWTLHKMLNRGFKYLILVPSKQLVAQFYKDLLDYGFDKEKITKFTAGLRKKDGLYNPNAQIIIANRSYVFNHKDELPKLDCLICDECHTCTATSTADYVERLDVPIKIACSATVPRDKWNRWKLLGMFCKVVYEEDITSLQDQGYLSKLKITLLKIQDKVVEQDRKFLFHLDPLVKYRPDESGYSDIAFDEAYHSELDYINEHYIDLYSPILDYLNKLVGNTLVLFDRIEFGTNMQQLCKDKYPEFNVEYIDGSVDVDTREQIRAKLESSNKNILFASTATMSTGINIKNLTNICFLFNTKSASRCLQSVGRILRLHKDKTEAHLVDIALNFKYSKRHSDERLKLYKEMYGKKPDEIIKIAVD